MRQACHLARHQVTLYSDSINVVCIFGKLKSANDCYSKFFQEVSFEIGLIFDLK